MRILTVKDIIKLSIHDIYVNPENPRHDVVMDIDESFTMQQLIKTKKDTQAMYKLISDIYNAGWFPQSIVTVTYDAQKKKYVAWDGNRRLTALKILHNPELLKNFKYFTYTQRNKIADMHKGIKDESFYEVSCYVASSFEECADYIRTIHTTDTGALPWTDIAKKRFENKLGIKNTFSQLKEYCKEPFENISDNFSVNKFEKLVNSRVGKEYLEIDNTDNILTHNSSIEELEQKLKRIVEDIDSGKLKNENIKNTTEMKKYLYGEEKSSASVNRDNIISSKIDSVTDTEKALDVNDKNLKKNDNDFKKKDNINEQLTIEITGKHVPIRKSPFSPFVKINIKGLKRDNPRAAGIHNLCYEVLNMSLKLHNKEYCIAFAFLIRSLLEQTSIYFLINKGKWEKLKEGNNNKELKLEQIIKELERNKHIYFDGDIIRCWNTFNSNTAIKDYFDMIVHHPHLISANSNVIDIISDSGLYAVIQYFLNN